MPVTPFDEVLNHMMSVIPIMLLIVLMLGIVVSMFRLGDGIGILLPLVALIMIGTLLPVMTRLVMPPGLETPAALSDVPDTDWSAVWSVLKWIGFGVSIPISLFVVWMLSVWTRRAFISFVSPPPRWLCRWLKRPMPPVIRPLPVAPYPLDTPVLLVLDDPIFAQIDHAIASADRALKEDRLS